MCTCLLFASLKESLKSSSRESSARLRGEDRKKKPAYGTNQIAGFEEFRPITNFEKNKYIYNIDSSVLLENI